MPAKKCENGKWKWGESGSCVYDSKKDAEDANSDYRDERDVNLNVTEGMKEEAARGKAWREEFGRGGTEVGLKTANMILSNSMTEDRVKKMFAYFERHETYKDAEGFRPGEKGYPSNSRIAHSLWGGDAGHSWSEKKRNQLKNEEEERVTKKIKTALENKVKDHNEDVKDSKKDWNTKVSYAKLEKVFDRGVGAYNTNPQSVRPSVKSPEQWAMARVNSFLYALKNGKFRGGKHDTDLLPDNHPVVKKMKEEKNLRKKVGSMITDGVEMPLFDSSKEAEQEAEKLGGSGFHEHTLDGKTVYMPFKSHEEIMDVMNNRTIKNNTMEKRIFNVETRVDTTEDGKDVVVGYASVYDSRSNNLGGFYEYIERGAFTDELIANSDVRALINHDPNLILARNKSGTLKLSADERGLKYEFEMPETSYGKDLAISMKRGDISQSSFAFTVAEDDWSTDDEGNNIRTIKKIDRLFDTAVVTYPAYNQADSDLVVAQRGLEAYKQSLIEETKEEKIEEKENNLVRGSLISLNIELKKRK
tara:strand:+ start:3495 stop:5084 length:1590 start_codon:yes stop_codon:yes gene_type:complete